MLKLSFDFYVDVQHNVARQRHVRPIQVHGAQCFDERVNDSVQEFSYSSRPLYPRGKVPRYNWTRLEDVKKNLVPAGTWTQSLSPLSCPVTLPNDPTKRVLLNLLFENGTYKLSKKSPSVVHESARLSTRNKSYCCVCRRTASVV
jgi:hypothetical protein